MRGGMEAVCDDIPDRPGFARFAPRQPARGPMFSARQRARVAGDLPNPVVTETELYGADRASPV